MSYFPTDIPFMSEEELKENGIKVNCSDKPNNSKLRECPFCGGSAELSSGRFDGKDTSYVLCVKCGARGEFFIVSPKYASAEKAIKAWNRRNGE